MSRNDPVEFCGEIKHETEMAYLVNDGTNDVWLPKSQVKEMERVKPDADDHIFVIPEWLAIEKEII